VANAALRVALGPVEMAGTARALADGLKSRGHHAEVVLWATHPFGYTADALVPSRSARVRFARSAPRRYDVLHGQGGRSWFSYLDLCWARPHGTLCLIQYNGTDCRTSDIARRLHRARARAVDPELDRNVRKHRWLGAHSAQAAVVQDLELASYLVGLYRAVYVLPFAIRLPSECPSRGAEPERRVTVLHAPSNRGIKGSDLIERTVRALGRSEPIELVTVTGRPRTEVLARIDAADVVIDQLNSETYGVLAAEAMALGKPVICEFDPRKLAPTTRDAPIVHATPETLSSAVLALARDPKRRARLGRAGVGFARAKHAAEVVAAAAERLYAHARERAPGVFEATPEGIRSVREELAIVTGTGRVGGD
jgi:hypothetical protein